jgi:hypothetical protein
MGFFMFWWECFLIASTFGNGVFSFVEILCAYLWIFHRAKGEDNKAKQREEAVKNIAKYLGFGLLASSMFILAPYLKYQESEARNPTGAHQLKLDALDFCEQLNEFNASGWQSTNYPNPFIPDPNKDKKMYFEKELRPQLEAILKRFSVFQLDTIEIKKPYHYFIGIAGENAQQIYGIYYVLDSNMVSTTSSQISNQVTKLQDR